MIERVTIPRTELRAALEAGALVLTGNARLSRSLRAEYDRSMLAAGREAWASPEVMPYTAWLKQAWEEAGLRAAAPLPRLLSQEQEAALWAGVLGQDDAQLLRPAATARAASRSWQLLHDYRLDLDEAAFGVSEDAQAFRRWARRFAAECARRECITGAELGDRLVAAFTDGMLGEPGDILLVGFYELTPAQLALIEAVESVGASVRWTTLAGVDLRAVRVPADDPLHELRLAADWARQVLEDDLAARVGIVVPELSTARVPLARFLGDALDPQALQPGAVARTRPWNFSLGEPLAAFPVIDTALHLLALAGRELTMEAAGALLASPYWAMPDEPAEHAAELARRALLDARLRKKHGSPRLSPRNLAYFAGQADEAGAPKPWAAPRLGRVLRRLQESLDALPARAGAAQWAHQFSRWLQAAGWCRGTRLDSVAYQAVEKWQELLSTLMGLDEFESELRLEGALSLIRRLAGETVFQPQAPEAQVPVQVLGLLEANEQQFDALWVLGLHDGLWPQPPSPDPFIPLPLQREQGLPGCDPARQLEQARQITAQLAAAARSVVFSHPAADGDEALRASPLMREFAEVKVESLVGEGRAGWRERVRTSAGLEALAAPGAIPFTGEKAQGGTQVIRHQAACPFRAFAEHRLGASPLDSPSLGLDPAERGSLMHKVLERFWRVTDTWQALVGLSEEDLYERVHECVAAAIEDCARQLEWQPQLSTIERQRLAGQAIRWLELEKQRAPFRVKAVEYPARLSLGSFAINTKVDRIDELDDGRLVIIDYKTGKVTPSGWFGGRPDDPQLPLYTRVPLPQPLASVAFGVVKADQQKFDGVVAAAGLLPGLPRNSKSAASLATGTWPQVLEDWSQVCAGLANEFSAGHLAVDPKKGLRTCESSYCTLAPLCRINTVLEAAVVGAAGEEEAAE